MKSLHFIVDGDLFKVSECGEWVTLVSLQNGEVIGHVNPIAAWTLAVRGAALDTLSNSK